MSALISRAALAERCASERTSLATTAKPRPCSPARAASTAAFSARMLVWNAMPSITPMMSVILRELALISSIVLTTRETTLPPSVAPLAAVVASLLASVADSEVWRTVCVSCSMVAAACCSADAVCSVRLARLLLPIAISPEAVAMLSVERRICVTVPRSDSIIVARPAIRLPGVGRCSCTDRSPRATSFMAASATAGSPPIWRSTLR